ncbi:hypothetical protein DFJ73DRAFT_807347 [Zopfochytrium polystomum]|nr:hypothetical protein DFJ73DRAFT_807347 [Zopfochytrium polystomum]
MPTPILKFLPREVRKACSCEAPELIPPRLDADDHGIAAVIDISGFTALTSNLLKVHGADGAAKLRDAVDSVFDVIIRIIHRRGGSIIKFAGDAAIACWSTSQPRLEKRNPSILESFLCALELLQAFKANSSQQMGIHIGMAFGQVLHIHLGQTEEQRGYYTGPERREYFIAGEAVSEAGRALDLGRRGDLALSFTFMLELRKEHRSVPVGNPKLWLARSDSFIIHDYEPRIGELVRALTNLFPPREISHEEREEGIDQARALQYLETSVRMFLEEKRRKDGRIGQTLKRQSGSLESSPRRSSETPKNSFDDYNEKRNVVVVFLQFPTIRLGADIGKSAATSSHIWQSAGRKFTESSRALELLEKRNGIDADLDQAQLIATIVMTAVARQGGSLRQINFDDKAFTALAVWGLRGLSHHRAEARFALSACLDIAAECSAAGIEGVRIGVASGVVYTGVFGNELRMDGTILGAPVNLAARLMCFEAPQTEPSETKKATVIFCDSQTQIAGLEEFQFGQTPMRGTLKGFSEQLDVYQLLSRSLAFYDGHLIPQRPLRVIGREQELDYLSNTVKQWAEHKKNQFIMVTGRSGYGKSIILGEARRELEQIPFVLISSSVGDEMKQKSSFGVLDGLLRRLARKLAASGVTPAQFQERCDFVRRQSLSTASSMMDMTISSNVTDPDWRYIAEILYALGIPRSVLRTFAAVPGLRVYENVQATPTLAAVGSDVATRLSFVFSQLVNAVSSIGFKVCLFWDDAQWFDRESLQTLVTLRKFCPAALFLIGARSREEWDFVEDFDSVASLCDRHLCLQPLTLQSVQEICQDAFDGIEVSERLIQQIMDRSLGVPAVVRMIINGLRGVEAGSKRRFLDAQLPALTTGGAIAAQLDSVHLEFRNLIQIASVLGQYFNLLDLCGITRIVESECDDIYSIQYIADLIQASDRFGFLICRNEQDSQYAFSTCIIHDGVLATILPQRKSDIHFAAFTHFRNRFDEEGEDIQLLQTIILHITKVSGKVGLKCEFLYKGFISAASFQNEAEAFRCRDLLLSLDATYFENLPILDQIISSKMLADMYCQVGCVRFVKRQLLNLKVSFSNSTEAVKVLVEQIRKAGQSDLVSKRIIPFIRSFTYHQKFLKRIGDSTDPNVRFVYFEYLLRTFPLLFPGKYYSRRRNTKLSKVFNESLSPATELDQLVGVNCNSGDGTRRLNELSLVMEALVLWIYERRVQGFNYLNFQMSSTLLIRCAATIDPKVNGWRLKLAYMRLGLFAAATRKAETARRYRDIAESLPEDMSTSWDYACKSFTRVLDVVCRMFDGQVIDSACIVAMKEALDCIKEAGLEFDETARTMLVSLHTFLFVNGELELIGPPDEGGFKVLEEIELNESFHMSRRSVFLLKVCYILEMVAKCRFEDAAQTIVEHSDIILEKSSIRKPPTVLAGHPIMSLSVLTKLCRSICMTLELSSTSEGEDDLLKELEYRGAELCACFSRTPTLLMPSAILSVFTVAITITNFSLFVLEAERKLSTRAWKKGDVGRMKLVAQSIFRQVVKASKSGVKTRQMRFCNLFLRCARNVVVRGRPDKFVVEVARMEAPGPDLFPDFCKLLFQARNWRAKGLLRHVDVSKWISEGQALKGELERYCDKSEIFLIDKLLRTKVVGR